MNILNAGVFPERITVEVTNSCNISCSFCPRHIVDMDLGYMSKELFYKIIDEAALHLPVTAVLFFRGEPLLHPHLAEFIQYAKKNGIGPIQIASNGLALNEEIGDQLIDAGLDFISFSLDTDDPEIYKKARLHGDLLISKKNILNFIRKCEQLRTKGIETPEIQISTIDIEEYRKEQSDFITFWEKYADRVRVYIEHSSDGNLGSIKNAPLGKENRKPCKKVYSDLIVYWNGKIALCNHDWNNQLNIGDVNTEKIQDIWTGNAYKQIRLMHEQDIFEESISCKHCDHWQMYYLEDGLLGRVYNKKKEG